MSFRALLIMAFCNIAWALNVVVSKLAITDFSAPPLFYALVRSIIVAAVLIPLLRPLPAKLLVPSTPCVNLLAYRGSDVFANQQ